MIDHQAAALALRNRLLDVAWLPTANAWENQEFIAVPGTPYLADQYVPATHSLVSLPARGGTVEETGLYIVQWFGVWNSDESVIRNGAAAIVAAFTPGTEITTTAGDVLRVRTDTAPVAGQIIPMDSSWSLCVIRIPWRARSQNTIAP